MDIKSKLNIGELDNIIIYLIIFKDLIPNKANSINIKLADKAFSYLLTTVNIIKITTTALNTDPFAYNINTKL